MQPLSQATQGTTCTIKWMFGAPDVLQELHRLQLREGSIIQVVRKYKDCLIIRSRMRTIALGNETACRIQV